MGLSMKTVFVDIGPFIYCAIHFAGEGGLPFYRITYKGKFVE